eukprot:m.112763 g.112763  ORF g.112763 m.112763 type:complete len:101 (-) comp9258_c2_seq3:2647-2949(-)
MVMYTAWEDIMKTTVFFLLLKFYGKGRKLGRRVQTSHFLQESAIAVVDDVIVLIGGWDGCKALDEVWAYDTISEKWSQLASLPTPIHKACAVACVSPPTT